MWMKKAVVPVPAAEPEPVKEQPKPEKPVKRGKYAKGAPRPVGKLVVEEDGEVAEKTEEGEVE
jgi:hypothetical protein